MPTQEELDEVVRASEDCAHVWEPTAIDENGDPDFRPNRQFSNKHLAHVVCVKCSCRTWMTRAGWDALEDE